MEIMNKTATDKRIQNKTIEEIIHRNCLFYVAHYEKLITRNIGLQMQFEGWLSETKDVFHWLGVSL